MSDLILLRSILPDDDLAAMYLTAKMQGKPRSADDHEEIELLLESFSKQCEEIVSEVETLSVNLSFSPLRFPDFGAWTDNFCILLGQCEAHGRYHRIDSRCES